MTKEEAIKVLEMFLHKQCDLERTKFAYDANTVWEAVNMAIKALEREPSEDCVSRATVLALINDVKNVDGFKEYSQYEYLFDQVDNMPMATPTRKKGKWIDKEKIMFPICSKCGLTSVEKYSFCPNCGAEMESE